MIDGFGQCVERGMPGGPTPQHPPLVAGRGVCQPDEHRVRRRGRGRVRENRHTLLRKVPAGLLGADDVRVWRRRSGSPGGAQVGTQAGPLSGVRIAGAGVDGQPAQPRRRNLLMSRERILRRHQQAERLAANRPLRDRPRQTTRIGVAERDVDLAAEQLRQRGGQTPAGTGDDLHTGMQVACGPYHQMWGEVLGDDVHHQRTPHPSQYVDITGELVARAASLGVRYCLENVSYGLMRTPADLGRHREAIPDLSYVVDFKSAWKSGHAPAEFLMPASVRSVHHTHVSFRHEGRYGLTACDVRAALEDPDIRAALAAPVPHVLEVEATDAGQVATSLAALRATRDAKAPAATRDGQR